jgi:PRTRC genetic system protein D
MIRAGIDVGFGDTKLAWHEDSRVRTLAFPSVLGHAESRVQASIGLGGSRKAHHVIEYDGQSYFVGEASILESRMPASRQDADRIGSVEERVLMLSALAQAGIAEALLVTGLPVLWWDRRRDLVRSWTGQHLITVDGKIRTITISEVKPVWQPLGTFYAHFLDQDGKALADEATLRAGYGIVDVGMNTTDFCGLQNLRPVSRWTSGIRVGVRDALGIIADDIEARYSVRRPIAEIGLALRTHGEIQVFRDRYTLEDHATQALHSLADQIVGEVTTLWDQADRFNTVLITGGGAALVGKAVKAAFPRNAEIVPSPAMANALGFACFAQRKVFTVDRE